MNIKKLLQIFLGSWAILIFLVVLTDAGDLTPLAQVGCTGVLALLIALLAVAATWGERKKRSASLYAPGSKELLYRVDGDWIHRGSEEKASWYIKRNKVYGFDNMTPICSMKDGKITREGESEPFLRVEENKIISCESGEVVYEIR